MTSQGHHSPSPDSPFVGLRWAIKRSFVDYVGRMPDGRGTVTGGATPMARNEIVYENDPAALPDADGCRRLAFRGDVRFAGHQGMLFVRIADPVVTMRTERAELSVIDHFMPGARIDLVTFTMQPHPCPPGFELWAGTDVRLTEAGSSLFNDVYEAGEPFDSLLAIVPARADQPRPS